MSFHVFKGLCCAGAMSLLACQNTTSTITPNPVPVPVSIACDAKQAGGKFTACSPPLARSDHHAAMGGDVHTGQRFAVNGSFEGVLR